jgi:leucyl-tRNA synthetase
VEREYDSTAVEEKWRKKWEEEKIYEVDLKRAKNPYYSLVMFPYPSGDKLHVGHWYNFAPADSFSRFMRMQGKEVLAPIGFDAFGLPAENYAVKTGIHPDESITENTKTMTEQLRRIGCMYDWSKSVNTSKSEYYQWTQWLFLQMFKKNLAYRKEQDVNFCPKCQTVLANEQCQDGTCERCDTEVVQQPMTQWLWKITDYAQRMLDGLEKIDWPEKTKLMQTNWIGRSEGAEVIFEVDGSNESIEVFTTRPDTLFGATYMVLSPEHPLVDSITTNNQRSKVESYRNDVKKKTEIERTDIEREKTGVFTGCFAVNPVNKEKMPVWIADYVLMNYGTGAIMAVPGHDERDYDFACRHELDIACVIEPDRNIVNFSNYVYRNAAVAIPEGKKLKETQDKWDLECINDVLSGAKCWTGPGKNINSDFLNGLKTEEAKKKMIDWLEKNKKGKGVVQYRLRDWSISRQRYWGAPIPIVYDPEGTPHPVPEEHLPWKLPTDVEFKPTGTAPLAQSKELKERTEKLFGKGWTPEVDTMDTFVCSSFYQFRYLAEGNEKEMIPKDIEKNWMPVDMYIGGAEHACMHLIYARFVTMALKDFGFVKCEEPFKKLVHQGIITNQGAKMSKSKGNVVSPDAFIDRYGSDVFRLYLMFMGPFTEGGDWSDTGIKGTDRFVKRIWKILNKRIDQCSVAVEAKVHATVKKCTEDIPALRFNTAIAALMELLNDLEKQGGISDKGAKIVTRLLAPIAPHLAEELWESIGCEGFVIDQTWPEFDEKLLKTDTVTVAIQVNGKVRAEMEVPTEISEKDVIAQAKEQENVKKYIDGKKIRKEVYVPGKLVSLVV